MDDRRDIAGIRHGGRGHPLVVDLQSASHRRDKRFRGRLPGGNRIDGIGKPSLRDRWPPPADRSVRIVDRAPVGDAATGIDHKRLRCMGRAEAAAEGLASFPEDREGEGPVLKMGDRLLARHRLVGDDGDQPHRHPVWPSGSGHLLGDLSQPRQRPVGDRAGGGDEDDDIDGVLPVIERVPPALEVGHLDHTGFPNGRKWLRRLESTQNAEAAKTDERYQNRGHDTRATQFNHDITSRERVNSIIGAWGHADNIDFRLQSGRLGSGFLLRVPVDR